MSRLVRDRLAEDGPTFSFEFFPPKTPDEDRLLWQTIRELEPQEVWITHGREEALKHWCMTHQIKACELNLVGYEDEDD